MENKDKELKDTIEIICNEVTYTSKKMNPIRRALIIKKLVAKMTVKNIQADPKVGVDALGDLFEKNLPEVMWEFVKDDDKTKIGTYEKFVDDLDDKCCMNFLDWSIGKINQVTDFLEQSKVKKSPA